MTPNGITLAMIVRDEAEFLPQCLASVQNAVEHMVVVDTGSEDNTVAIAEAAGAEVLHFTWIDDFSAARNHALDAVKTPWTLILDADETLVTEDIPELLKATQEPWADAYNLRIVSLADRSENISEARVTRLFRTDPRVRFSGAVHEQVIPHLFQAGMTLDLANIRLIHAGYLSSVIAGRDKLSRNLALLENAMRREPLSAYLHWQTGQTLLQLHRHDDALREIRLAMKMAHPTEPLSPLFRLSLAKTHWAKKEPKKAYQVLRDGLQMFPTYTDFVYTEGLIALDTGELDRAERAFLRAVEMGEPKNVLQTETGIAGFKSLYRLAQIALLRGAPSQATAYLLKTLEGQPLFREGWRLLLTILKNNPIEVIGNSVGLVMKPDAIVRAFSVWPQLEPPETALLEWAKRQLQAS